MGFTNRTRKLRIVSGGIRTVEFNKIGILALITVLRNRYLTGTGADIFNSLVMQENLTQSINEEVMLRMLIWVASSNPYI